MTATLTGLGVPNRVEKGRSVEFEWEVRKLAAGEAMEEGHTAEGYGERTVLAQLNVSHHKAGMNYFSGERTDEDYFSVTLQNVTVEQRGMFTSYGYRLGSGLGIARYPAGNRYSKKKLTEAADRAITEFIPLYESGNEKVLRYFTGRG